MELYITIIMYLSIFSGPLVMAIGYKHWRSYWWVYLLISFLADFVSSFILKPYGYNYRWPSNVYRIAEFLLISFYVRQFLSEKVKQWFVGFIITGLCVILANIWYSGFFSPSTNGYIVHVVYMVYGCIGFYLILNQPDYNNRLEKQSYFWINVMLIVHSAMVFTMNLFAPYMYKNHMPILSIMWPVVIGTANTIQHILLAIAFTRKDYK